MRTGCRPGFVLPEVVALLTVVVVVAALLAVLSTRSRSLASLGESMANLRRMHQGIAAFGEDNENRYPTFSWRKGPNPSQYVDLQSATDDIQAAANQAVDIIRRRANLTSASFPKISGWIPHIYYSHLVVEDYLGMSLPSRMVILRGAMFV